MSILTRNLESCQGSFSSYQRKQTEVNIDKHIVLSQKKGRARANSGAIFHKTGENKASEGLHKSLSVFSSLVSVLDVDNRKMRLYVSKKEL